MPEEKTSSQETVRKNDCEISMTYGGIGPKLALLCLPYIILSIVVIIRYPEFLDLGFLDHTLFQVIGFIWLGLGFVLWVTSAVFFLIYFKHGRLITNGPYALCRNPIYSSLIVFIIPALGIIFHSGLIFSIALVLYVGFKISIHGENIVLRRAFGEEFGRYEESVNELLPFPRFLFRSGH
ncbi:MAG: methyltransferase [Actinomycetota bacterium]